MALKFPWQNIVKVRVHPDGLLSCKRMGLIRGSLEIGQRVVSRARVLLNEEIKEGTISEVHDQEITVKWDAEYGSSS